MVYMYVIYLYYNVYTTCSVNMAHMRTLFAYEKKDFHSFSLQITGRYHGNEMGLAWS